MADLDVPYDPNTYEWQHLHHFSSKVGNQNLNRLTKAGVSLHLCVLVRHKTLEIVLVTPRQNPNTLTNASFRCCPTYRFRCFTHNNNNFVVVCSTSNRSTPILQSDKHLIQALVIPCCCWSRSKCRRQSNQGVLRRGALSRTFTCNDANVG